MSAERTIANLLRIAREDLEGARTLNQLGNRNAAYLCEQAAEKVFRAILISETVHAGIGHAMNQWLTQIPDANPIKARLAELVPLASFATAYRYPTSARVPPAPPKAVLELHIARVQATLEVAVKAFSVKLDDTGAPAGSAAPPR